MDEDLSPKERARVRAREKKSRPPQMVVDNAGVKRIQLALGQNAKRKKKRYHDILVSDRPATGPARTGGYVSTIRKAVFPAAGLGTRFRPATKAQPKEMLPTVDKPII